MHNAYCANYTCTGSIPSHATLVSGSDQNLTSNVENKLYESEAEAKGKKCAYVCNESAGYSYLNGQCVHNEPDPNDDEYQWACLFQCTNIVQGGIKERKEYCGNPELEGKNSKFCLWVESAVEKEYVQCDDFDAKTCSSKEWCKLSVPQLICTTKDIANNITSLANTDDIFRACQDDTVDGNSNCPCSSLPKPPCGDDPLAYESPQCGDAKYTCTPGTASNKKGTNSSYSWTCSNGGEKVSCEIGITCESSSYEDESLGSCTSNNGSSQGGSFSSCTDCQCKETTTGLPQGKVRECNRDCCYANQPALINCKTVNNKLGCDPKLGCTWNPVYVAGSEKFVNCYKKEGRSTSTTIDNKSSWCGGFSCGVATPGIINNSSIDVCTGIPIPSNSYCFDNGDKCEEDASKKYGSSNIGIHCQSYGYDTRGRGCYCYR